MDERLKARRDWQKAWASALSPQNGPQNGRGPVMRCLHSFVRDKGLDKKDRLASWVIDRIIEATPCQQGGGPLVKVVPPFEGHSKLTQDAYDQVALWLEPSTAWRPCHARPRFCHLYRAPNCPHPSLTPNPNPSPPQVPGPSRIPPLQAVDSPTAAGRWFTPRTGWPTDVEYAGGRPDNLMKTAAEAEGDFFLPPEQALGELRGPLRLQPGNRIE